MLSEMDTKICRARRGRRCYGSGQNARCVNQSAPLPPNGACQIINHLYRADAFRETGLDVSIDMFGSAIVHCRGAYRGAWNWDGAAFAWIPAGYRQPQKRVRTSEEAAHQTVCFLLEAVGRSAQAGSGVTEIEAALGVVSAADNDNAIKAKG